MDTLRRILRAANSGRLSDDQVDRAFRAAHSLKSVAGFQQLDGITSTAHALEDVLLTVRDAGGVLGEGVYEKLKSGVSVLDSRLNEYYGQQPGTATPTREEAIEVAQDDREARQASEPSPGGSSAASLEEQLSTATSQSVLREARQRGESIFRIAVRIESAAELSYPRAFLVLNNLELGSAVVAVSPSLDELAASGGLLSVVVTTTDDEMTLRRRVHVDQVTVEEIVSLGYEQMLSEDGRDSGRSDTGTDADEPLSDLGGELRLLGDVLRMAARHLQGDEPLTSDQRSFVRQTIQRVSHYLSNRVAGARRLQLLERMESIKEEMERYAGTVDKRVRITVGGSGAAVSPAVADAVNDVVLHLVRNSIEHGIQYGPQRISSGKRPGGRIEVSTHRGRGGLVTVSVADDGVGVDEEQLRAELTRDDPLAADKSLFELLSTPGYTTRDEPSIGAGRGVGLDAVRHTVEHVLRGTATVESFPGRGTTTRITFSADVALLPVALVTHGRSLYAVPAALIVRRETLDPQRLKRDSFGSTYYESGGSRLPVVLPSGRGPRVDKLDPKVPALVCRGPGGLTVVTVESHIGTESVVRDDENRRVYSRKSGTEAHLVIPGIL